MSQELGAAYANKFEEVSSQLSENSPIPVGYEAAKRVRLPVVEATEVKGDLRFKEGHAWANDWIIDWNDTAEMLVWEIEVQQSGTYQIALEYTTKEENTGSLIAIRVADQEITATIDEAYDTAYLPSPDRVKRKEVYEKDWAQKKIGDLYLEAGRHELSLRALRISGEEVAEIKSIYLVLQD